MTDKLTKYIISIPEELSGTIAGELHKRGAWMDSMRHDGVDLFIIEARANAESMIDFNDWLNLNTNGCGTIKCLGSE